MNAKATHFLKRKESHLGFNAFTNRAERERKPFITFVS